MFSNPTAVIALVLGEVLSLSEDAVMDFDDSACREYDNLLQEFALFARDTIREKARKVVRIHVP